MVEVLDPRRGRLICSRGQVSSLSTRGHDRLIPVEGTNQPLLGEPLHCLIGSTVCKLRRAKPPLQATLQLVAVPRLLDQETQDSLSRGERDHLCSRTPHPVEPYRTLGLG